MTSDQIITLLVLIGVVAALIWDRVRSDVVALTGAAILLITGAIRPIEVQGAFASPAILALASLFVIAYAMELSGLLDFLIRKGVALCRRTGETGLWLMLALCGAGSAFLNNTPIVVMAAPVVRDVAGSMGLSPRRFLMPLSYIAVLGGTCTLIGTSTNLLVDDMARSAGQRRFGVFEITPVGLTVAVVGALYLFLISGRLLGRREPETAAAAVGADQAIALAEAEGDGGQLGRPQVFAEPRPFRPLQAFVSLGVFVGVILLAALNLAPIAAAAFAGAVLLVLLRIISADEAYRGLRPQILLLIAGMVVIGLALDETGLAASATNALVRSVEPLGPLSALAILYGATLFLTELLSNATVAVLVTPVAVALADSLGVDARPFLIAVMMAGSAAFATPFGYQTNVIVYQMGGYRFTDFIRVGLPLNLITWATAVFAITRTFPF